MKNYIRTTDVNWNFPRDTGAYDLSTQPSSTFYSLCCDLDEITIIFSYLLFFPCLCFKVYCNFWIFYFSCFYKSNLFILFTMIIAQIVIILAKTCKCFPFYRHNAIERTKLAMFPKKSPWMIFKTILSKPDSKCIQLLM